ncbi:hypothetical protein EVAR_2699_1 [Eumeta japonica]|uniref:Uncharacterized protein n=1 Tax=Eumeta variegata TaxID=151549 RepID=A0A4C1SN09_EUMVA|nr:hypothetical protein EVAR_2699_1 [Eumeta japonica]
MFRNCDLIYFESDNDKDDTVTGYNFDVTTSYKLVCRVTLQETGTLRRVMRLRASENASLPLGHGSPPKSERETNVKGTRPFH